MSKRTPTKQRLLTILKKANDLTITEIMEHFTISEIAVRKQLHELVQQGFVKQQSHKQKLGRPYLTYDLTQKGHETFPNQYKSIPVELLEDLEELHGPQAVRALLDKHGEREKAYMNNVIQEDDLDKKVAEMVRVQNERGYMVEVEKVAEGDFEVRNYNCPVAAIARCYHQMCTNEQKLYEEIFPGSEVSAYSFITQGDHVCKWKIKNPNGR
ncbi:MULTISPECIES: helix-turn-helix transcriptional regulator [Oceanobacillus]|uniref:DeoR family transcriptional regulator n=1 Tax=Oceanobacillus profundus TaxID=372463 RepID=A0A417YMQ5_9BACI|nr:DeoR family transcriptional regulator [Oceanobacillus profundus]MBR3120994.1 DeoR family transcriptional regulator [Oceanobacillus sp.]MCM3399092.1 DeoR family transcriptional regulator [Oceanobacillus profundus]PAE29743.1 hypothetical protein CHI07_07935 [Paenibacillus sp. 7884-2]RHW34548.1 DeoR family transcriptional regulator [Oceanobacillus profundus]